MEFSRKEWECHPTCFAKLMVEEMGATGDEVGDDSDNVNAAGSKEAAANGSAQSVEARAK